jgi:hypothetical protein
VIVAGEPPEASATQSASIASPGTAPDEHDTDWSGCPTGFHRAR